ncbi:MAG: ComEC/Rec2 family competence protein [Pseudonocardiaceae bacterium]
MAEVLIDFLDVGQGDGTLITGPGSELILVDLGSKKNAAIAGGDAITFLLDEIEESMKVRGKKSPVLDHLMITHGDGDHYSLLPLLLAKVKVKFKQQLTIYKVTIGGDVKDYASKPLRDHVLKPAAKNKVLEVLRDGDHDKIISGKLKPRWKFGYMDIFLLSANFPFRSGGGKNAKSLVLMVKYADRQVILTGDAEAPTEAAILKNYKPKLAFLQSTALKLGHHGSEAGSSEAWIKAIRPKLCFASSDMKWAHPYCVTVNRIKTSIGPGLKLYKHQWMCGEGAGAKKTYNDYDNEQGFYTTMAYTDIYGVVQGVQYVLKIEDTGDMYLADTLKHRAGPFKALGPRRPWPDPAGALVVRGSGRA